MNNHLSRNLSAFQEITPRKFSVLLMGTLLMILGSVVIFSWYTHKAFLIQILPTFAPMQYNTALCFFFSGLALSAIVLKFQRVSLVSSFIVGFIAVETLLQYIFKINLGIDQLFIEGYLTTNTLTPGRMSPNTAMCFLLSSCAILLARFSNTKNPILISVFGSIVLAFAMVTVMGYLTGIEIIYGWGFLTRMALHTAIGFLLLGISIALLPGPQRNPYISVVIVVTTGLTLSIFSFGILRNLEDKNIESQFKLESNSWFSIFSREIQSNLEVVRSIRAFFEASENVEQKEFEIFTRPLLDSHRSIKALSWVPYVTEEKRTEFEEKVKNDGFSDFGLQELNSLGQLISASERSEYFPVQYIQPYEGNEIVLGVDLNSNPIRSTTLKIARNSGQMVATAPLKLIEDKEGDLGLLVFMPVYLKEGLEDNFIWRYHHIFGFASCTLIVEDVVQTVLSYYRPQGIDFYIFDRTDASKETPIYIHLSKTSKNEKLNENKKGKYRTSFFHHQDFFVAGRQWVLKAVPNEEYFYLKRKWYPWSVLAIGFLFTYGIAFYIISSIGRTRQIQDEVKKRTVDLARTNLSLEAEIRERKKTEEALRESQQLVKGIIDNTTAVIYVKEFLNSNGTYLLINKQFENIFNIMKHRIIGKNDYEIFPKETSDSFRQVDMKVFKSGQIVESEESVPQSDGEHTYLSIKVPLTNQDGKIYAVCGISTDITERKKMEEKTKDLANVKSEFVSMVSHELRTPLQVIIAGIDAVYDEILGPVNAEQKDILETVKRNVDRLTRLIHNVLEYQKLEAGRLEFYFGQYDLNEIIKDAVNDFISVAKEKKLNLDFQPSSQKITVYCDKDKITQVIINLLNNAVKFTDKGNISVTSEILEPLVRVSIKDQGIGIREENLSKLFESFSQVGDKDFKRTGGTGLGLSICKKIIERHHGRIGVESKYGQGSIFYFVLPISKGS